MKRFRYSRNGNLITKIHFDETGNANCYEPMVWENLCEFAEWCIETIDDPDLNEWQSEEVRDQALKMLEVMREKFCSQETE